MKNVKIQKICTSTISTGQPPGHQNLPIFSVELRLVLSLAMIKKSFFADVGFFKERPSLQLLS